MNIFYFFIYELQFDCCQNMERIFNGFRIIIIKGKENNFKNNKVNKMLRIFR